MTLHPTPATACPRCSGTVALDQIGAEVDAVCMACGWRKVAVARVAFKSSAFEMKVQRVPLPARDCVRCRQNFAPEDKKQIYCTYQCSKQGQHERALQRQKEAANA